jgi:hypothetical protein
MSQDHCSRSSCRGGPVATKEATRTPIDIETSSRTHRAVFVLRDVDGRGTSETGKMRAPGRNRQDARISHGGLS